MDGKIGLETLIFLLIAVVIIWRLRSVLGRRTGDERTRYERSKAEQARRAEAQARTPAPNDKVVTLPRREPVAGDGAVVMGEERFRESDEERIRKFAGTNLPLAEALLAIARHDKAFDPEEFLRGGRQAYEMIVSAFAIGDRKTLKGLLSAEVFDGFERAISEREARGERIEQSFVGIDKADIVEADLKDGMAHVTVKFVSALITATIDTGGQIVSGDSKKIVEVTDIWTFARDVASRDPNWHLVATEAAH